MPETPPVQRRSTPESHCPKYAIVGRNPLRSAWEPPAVRFQAGRSNDCWHFDLSPSDLKHVKRPAWFEPSRTHHQSR
ncbi:hypothetical protein F2Q65_00555 [Thiohalocapsa marina]|uniref:Uncharacterized protein n=1 Tax=Thiohalocapsa marina TaxID=424902 RepID=A0A5M8FVB6_9GAMM|nr:hypothetical protein F2Q65_00555 [Thiohalocapsa marina]